MNTDTAASAEEKIITAAMQLAALKGWGGFSLFDLKNEIPDIDIKNHIKSKKDILIIMNQEIDSFVEENMGHDDSLSLKELLFDFFMLRMEYLDRHKEGIIRLYEDARRDPDLLVCCIVPIYESVQSFGESHENSTKNNNLKLLNLLVFSAMYVRVLSVWKDDRSEELSKTMAYLDKILTKACSIFSL